MTSECRGSLNQPTTWRRVGSVSGLYIYPVKSCAGVSVSSFTTARHAAETAGMVDRQLMIVDKKNKLMTARVYPHMVLIGVSVSDGRLRLTYPGMSELTVILPTDTVTCVHRYAVFSEAVSGYDLGEEVSSWLSEVILNDPEGGARLIFHPRTQSSRPDKVHDAVSPNMKTEDKPYYADTFAYMMLSQPSISGLNQMLREGSSR